MHLTEGISYESYDKIAKKFNHFNKQKKYLAIVRCEFYSINQMTDLAAVL